MPLHFKKDMQATREARRSGQFLSKESFISQPKWVGNPNDPTSHFGPHEVLAGADARRRHDEILARDKHRCIKCGAVLRGLSGLKWTTVFREGKVAAGAKKIFGRCARTLMERAAMIKKHNERTAEARV